MFLKNVVKTWFKSLSISKKITYFYGCLTLLLLMSVLSFLHWSMLDVLHKMDYQFLRARAEAIKTQFVNQPFTLSSEIHQVDGVPLELKDSIYRYYVRVIDDRGFVTNQTAGTPAKLNENYLVVETRIPEQHRTIQVISDFSYQHRMIKEYCNNILLALSIGGLLAILIGYLIACRSMRRLNDLTDAAKRISIASLNQRINSKDLPKELQTLSSAFNQMLDRIEVSFSRIKKFSDDLAHELRTPINNIMGETEIVLTNPTSKEIYQQTLQSNLEELNRLQQIIENIFFLSRIESPYFEIEKQLISVEKEIGLICEFYEAMAAEKEITILQEGSALCWANKIMLQRALSNVLSNAIKYTQEKGIIKFHVQASHPAQIQITLTDDGRGIPSEHLPHIFDRFYRVDHHSTRGLGLGLAIVKSIMDLHKGEIFIQSTSQQGTMVQLIFPK